MERLHRSILITVVVIGVLSVLLLLLVWLEPFRDGEHEESANLELSAWVTDWQFASGMEDAAMLDGLSSLHWFAVYFDEFDQLYFTPQSTAYFSEYQQYIDGRPKLDAYVTVVNDVWLSDGTAVQKDADLITRLVAADESRKQHLDDLVGLVARTDADGLELDYERVHDADWDGLLQLYADLYAALDSRGKKLRVILEPRAPVESVELPEGPEYVMMAYNLYGTHSGPGPKADFAFLRKMAEKMQGVPGDAVIALSLGGFAWAEDGRIRALTERQAAELADKYSDQRMRDESSGATYLSFTDDDGMQQTVWYADSLTIAGWIETLRESGIGKIALWRLGEIAPETLENLQELMSVDEGLTEAGRD